MPYGPKLTTCGNPAYGFQSLIWVACPTGNNEVWYALWRVRVSIPHMGCMPYGRRRRGRRGRRCPVSIPHMGCMPYGPDLTGANLTDVEFQSLIWVACPTGSDPPPDWEWVGTVSIPHMGCMPYGLLYYVYQSRQSHGFNPSYGLHALRAADTLPVHSTTAEFQSLIWVACPTGHA